MANKESKTTEETTEKKIDNLQETNVNVSKSEIAELEKVPQTKGNSMKITKKIIKSQKMITIIIPSTPNDKTAVFVSINGVNRNIPRDIEVSVPIAFVGVLNDAKTIVYTKDENASRGKDSAVINETEVQAIPYTVKI